MSNVDESQVGTTQPTDNFTIDSALADWIYHRDGTDQGFSLGDIVSNVLINQKARPFLEGTSLTMADDGFIYNLADGFTAAVVKIGGTYKVVFRGTDVGAAGNSDYIEAARHGDADPQKVDNYDIQQDVALGIGTRAASQASDAIALTKIVQDLAKTDNASVPRRASDPRQGAYGSLDPVTGPPRRPRAKCS